MTGSSAYMIQAPAALAALIYLLATGAHLASLLGGEAPRRERLALGATAGGALAHVATLVAVALAGGGAALVTSQGGVALGGAALAAIYLWLAWRRGLATLGSLVTPLTALSVAPLLFGERAQPVDDPLGGVLLLVHIVAALLGTVAFVLAFALAVLYVLQQRQLKRKRFSAWLRRLPSLERLDGMGLRLVTIGFGVYTLSILLGAFWAWRHLVLRLDPRSLLASLTWLIYALMIQGRITAGWRGRKAALLTIVGAVSAIGVLVVYLLRG